MRYVEFRSRMLANPYENFLVQFNRKHPSSSEYRSRTIQALIPREIAEELTLGIGETLDSRN